jgi:hypothetical protein
MPTIATATYFQKDNFGPFATRTGTLADNDLVRGDDIGEGLIAQGTTGFLLFNGYQTLDFSSIPYRFVDNTPEMLATVTFSDGTSISGVRGLYDQVTGAYGTGSQYFLLDPTALAAAGKTMADVTNIVRTSATDHDLSWSDFGISGDPVDPILPPPPPPPPPPPNRIEGTAGRDVLRGTAEDDLIIGNGGRDTLTGRGGEDTFVFGREANNGVREIDVITDYDAYVDTILLTDNARIARTIEGSTDITIVLAGADGDRIVLKNQPDSGPLYQILFDPDFFG